MRCSHFQSMTRFARTCSGHPRLDGAASLPKKDVDGRARPRQDDSHCKTSLLCLPDAAFETDGEEFLRLDRELHRQSRELCAPVLYPKHHGVAGHSRTPCRSAMRTISDSMRDMRSSCTANRRSIAPKRPSSAPSRASTPSKRCCKSRTSAVRPINRAPSNSRVMVSSLISSAHAAFETDGQELLGLDRELHGQFLQHFLAEAVDDQGHRILGTQPA